MSCSVVVSAIELSATFLRAEGPKAVLVVAWGERFAAGSTRGWRDCLPSRCCRWLVEAVSATVIAFGNLYATIYARRHGVNMVTLCNAYRQRGSVK